MDVISFKRSMTLLQKYRLKPHLSKTVENKEFSAVRKAADRIGYPCVLKLYSQEILHKAGAGAVKINLKDEGELTAAHKSLLQILEKNKIARFELVLQKQVNGFEVIIGGKNDPSFGPVVLFGLGGIYAEVLRQTAVRICPVAASAAIDMVNEIKVPLEDKRQVAGIISKVARLMENEKIQELDLNPVIINEQGCHIVDVRMLV